MPAVSILDWLGFGPKARAYIKVRWQIYEGAYHFYAERCARHSGLNGWMRVVKQEMYEYMEMEVEGPRSKIEKLLGDFQKGPPTSKATGIEVGWKTYKGLYHDFRTRV